RDVLAARDQLPARAPRPVLPSRGRRDGPALGGGLPATCRNSLDTRLVPPRRLSTERRALPAAQHREVPRLASRPRRPLRRLDKCAARLQRPPRGQPDSEWTLALAASLSQFRSADLQRSLAPADGQRCQRGTHPQLLPGPARPEAPATRLVPGGRPLLAVLGHVLGLPASGRT